MFSRKIVGKVLIPAATVLVVDKGKEIKCCRPSELPIYTSDPPAEPKKIMREPPTKVEQEIGNIRRQILSLTNEFTKLQDTVSDLYEEAYCEAEGLIEYLQEEDNTTPRYGAIAVGGVAGFILALRGGKFRKLLFTTIGALGMATICYPTEAAEYSEQIKEEAVKYFRIAYNFYHGVIGSKKSTSVCGDDLQMLNLEFDGPDVPDDNPPEVKDSEEVVTELHERAMSDECHCPVGTCLNPMDEEPPEC